MKSKLTAFATAVGEDIKDLRESKANKTDLQEINQTIQALQSREQGLNEQAVILKIEQAISAVKSELLGGEGLDATLDTLKEIGDKIKELASSDVGEAVTQKLTELKQQIDEIKDVGDLVRIYNESKGA